MAIYYVRKTGANGNTGSSANPWLTVQYGCNQLANGDTLIIGNGIYKEVVTIAKNNATVRSEIPYGAIITGGWSGPPNWPDYGADGTLPATSFNGRYAPLVSITGTGTTLSDISVTDSNARGIQSKGNNNVIYNCSVTGSGLHAISIEATVGCTIESCIVYDCGRINKYNNQNPTYEGKDIVAHNPSIVTMRNATNGTVRGCTISESFGEAIMIEAGANNILVEDNLSFDNYACQLYVHRCHDVIVRNNILYTSDTAASASRGRLFGLIITDEHERVGEIRSRDVDIYNNLIVNCSIGVLVRSTTLATPHLENFEISNNTIINCDKNFKVKKGDFAENTEFVNNISYAKRSGSTHGEADNIPGVTWYNNLWSSTNTDPQMISGTDVIGDPRFVNVGGAYGNPDNFKLTAASPAIDNGATI